MRLDGGVALHNHFDISLNILQRYPGFLQALDGLKPFRILFLKYPNPAGGSTLKKAATLSDRNSAELNPGSPAVLPFHLRYIPCSFPRHNCSKFLHKEWRKVRDSQRHGGDHGQDAGCRCDRHSHSIPATPQLKAVINRCEAGAVRSVRYMQEVYEMGRGGSRTILKAGK